MTKAQFIASLISGQPLLDDASVKAKLIKLAGMAYDATKFLGSKTAAEIAALVSPKNGDTYTVITTGGNLNAGGDAITTLTGDVVTYDEATGLWKFIVSGALINKA